MDSRGELFGRVNVIDAVAAVALAVSVTAGVLAYRVVRIHEPVITAVSPPMPAAGDTIRVGLTGRHFRPFLKAFVVARGSEPSAAAVAQPVQFWIGTPTAVELRLSALQPGTYDIDLYDGRRLVARRESAFTLASRLTSAGP